MLSVASIKPARAGWDQGGDWQTTPAHRHTIIMQKHTASSARACRHTQLHILLSHTHVNTTRCVCVCMHVCVCLVGNSRPSFPWVPGADRTSSAGGSYLRTSRMRRKGGGGVSIFHQSIASMPLQTNQLTVCWRAQRHVQITSSEESAEDFFWGVLRWIRSCADVSETSQGRDPAFQCTRFFC